MSVHNVMQQRQEITKGFDYEMYGKDRKLELPNASHI